MLRLHFTGADLARVRVVKGWGAFAETVYSLDALTNGRPSAMFGGWRRGPRGPGGAGTRMLTELLPDAYGIDLVSIAGDCENLDHALDRLLSAPRWVMKSEVEAAARFFRLPRWAARLHEPGGETRAHLASALAAHHRRFVAPHWAGIGARLEAERARLARELGDHGVGRVLATLHPAISWQDPVLTVRCRADAAGDVDRHLQGRGLVIVPSVFCAPGFPAVHPLADPEAPWALFYPVLRDPADALAVWRPGTGSDRALVALLGRTRATILRAVGDAGPITTTELATRAAVSIPSASQHATTLREASLITTLRHQGSALHTLTPLGAALLNA